ncbi:alkaline phosphatase [Parahaliea mediterranea]|uniref:Alkaline phosphatase n=1 Tax=Parahaliea mediterranea TaxID=651086 RepID=A0A939DDM9_9GAMM|nr:alkaline phosphatase [Parahaliea mediterranea]MBN7796251.1 alkaline phosphatase [Parahaliea mediterranea]
MPTLRHLASALTLTLASQVADAANVILIIGDGMDDQQVTIARNYLQGARGQLLLDTMPVRSAVQILTVDDTMDRRPVYVADSANTATSIATGEVSSRGRIGTTAGDDRDAETIVELARAAGLRTGVVTTASVTDATPASFAAHVSNRMCENPDAMVDITYHDIPLGGCEDDLKAAGGPGSIAEQLAVSGLDVLLGGGAKHFDPAVEGGEQSVARAAQLDGFSLVRSREELLGAPADARLLGLFAPSTLPVRLRGEDGREAEAAKPSLLNRLHRYLGDVTLPEPMTCEPNPAFDGTPSLKEMTDVALARLSADNERGFFLMVESASIDKQAHERKPCGSIGELQQLEEALASALDFAASHPDTLVLVTADHSQAAQLVPATSIFAKYNVPIYSPGLVARIITPEGSLMSVNYATNQFSHEEHTGASVPLYGNAVADGRVAPFIRQPDLFTIVRDYLGL